MCERQTEGCCEYENMLNTFSKQTQADSLFVLKINVDIKIHVYTEDYNKHFQINGDLLMLTCFHHIVRLDLRNNGVFVGQCMMLQDAEQCKTRVSRRCGNTIPHNHKMNVPCPLFPVTHTSIFHTCAAGVASMKTDSVTHPPREGSA